MEYNNPPIEERKDEKKYRLRLTLAYADAYLRKDICSNDDLYIGTGIGSGAGVSAVFTASEIAKLEEKYNLGSFEREEVIESDE